MNLVFWHLANTSGATEVVTERLGLFSRNEWMLSHSPVPEHTGIPSITNPLHFKPGHFLAYSEVLRPFNKALTSTGFMEAGMN